MREDHPLDSAQGRCTYFFGAFIASPNGLPGAIGSKGFGVTHIGTSNGTPRNRHVQARPRLRRTIARIRSPILAIQPGRRFHKGGRDRPSRAGTIGTLLQPLPNEKSILEQRQIHLERSVERGIARP